MNDENRGSLIATLISALIFACFCIPAGLWVLNWTRSAETKAMDSRSWPTVSGTVTGTEIEKHASVDDGPSYHALVSYSYDVNGKTFSSTGLYLSCTNSFPTREKAEQCLRNYPVGKKVTVHYNPRNPFQAALNIDVSPPNGCLYAFGSAFILMGLLPLLNLLFTLIKSRVTGAAKK